MISRDMKSYIEREFSLQLNIEHEPYQWVSQSGGSINHTYKLQGKKVNYFIKINDAALYPGMFEAEQKGLEVLTRHTNLYIPKVLSEGSFEGISWLILEYVETGTAGTDFWLQFGQGVAEMHRSSSPTFGLDHHNYIGSLKQLNDPMDRWIDFFQEMRLEVQIKLAVDQKRIDEQTVQAFGHLFVALEDIFPDDPPALLHGDLWNGNYMTGKGHRPVLIDPAVYYGHREMDLGMSRLFGGFDQKFYDAYHERYPLEAGWERRLDICNLYPLLVHVNLFGGSYLGHIKNILREWRFL